jgi:hypothetical protein
VKENTSHKGIFKFLTGQSFREDLGELVVRCDLDSFNLRQLEFLTKPVIFDCEMFRLARVFRACMHRFPGLATNDYGAGKKFLCAPYLNLVDLTYW